MCGVEAGAGVIGRLTPEDMSGAGAQANHVLQTPDPVATKQMLIL